MEVSYVATKELRERVLIQWLQGISRDEIARNVGIGAGTASAIFKMYRKNDSNFDQLREFALNVKRQGLTIDQLGSATRLDSRLNKLHLNEEEIESFLDKIQEHCFTQGIEPDEFIREVVNVCNLSSKSKVPVGDLSSEIEKKKRKLSLLGMDIMMKKLEWQEILRKANISETELGEFRENRPVFQSLQKAKADLANVTKEKNDAIRKLNHVNDKLDRLYSYPKDKKNDIENCNEDRR
jgi:hypothetical protein